MKTKTDAELVLMYADTGDDAVFAEIVSRHGPMVYRVCRGYVRDSHEAEDCAQAVFLVLVRKASSLRRGVNLTSWLYSVAKRVSLRSIEGRRNRAKREEQAAMSEQNDQRDESEQLTLVKEGLYRELDALSALQRQAVLLRYIEGHGEKQAAEIAGCSPSALNTRANDGIARLRKRFARLGTTVSLASLVGVLASEAQAAVPGTLLPSLTAMSHGAAASAAAGAAGTTGGTAAQSFAHADALAEGVIKMMMWSKVKKVMGVVGAVLVLTVGLPLTMPSATSQESNAEKPAEQQLPDRAFAFPEIEVARAEILKKTSRFKMDKESGEYRLIQSGSKKKQASAVLGKPVDAMSSDEVERFVFKMMDDNFAAYNRRSLTAVYSGQGKTTDKEGRSRPHGWNMDIRQEYKGIQLGQGRIHTSIMDWETLIPVNDIINQDMPGRHRGPDVIISATLWKVVREHGKAKPVVTEKQVKNTLMKDFLGKYPQAAKNGASFTHLDLVYTPKKDDSNRWVPRWVAEVSFRRPPPSGKELDYSESMLTTAHSYTVDAWSGKIVSSERARYIGTDVDIPGTR